jgi:4'-phosphopantetheinyl transferase
MIAPVELFLFDLDDPPPEEAPGWLAPAERERANRFATVLLRRRYTAGRAMLRRLLAERTGTRPAAVALVEDPDGKPRLADDARAFNLGHAGRHALVAIGPAGMRIGVDIEELRAVVDLETLVPTCLTLPERAEFEAIADEASRREAFLRLWVRKEACLKAIGKGLRIEPTAFAVGLAPPAADWPARVHDARLRVTDLDPGLAGLAAAIAVAGVDTMPRLAPLSRIGWPAG